MREFYIASVTHTHREHQYVTFWRPEDQGYAWPLSWSGRYTEEQVLDSLEYYNDGWHTIAIPVDVVQRLAVPPFKGTIDGDAGPVVMNTLENWKVLQDAVVWQPGHEVKLYPHGL